MTDVMTPEQRSRCMSRIRGKNTRPELLVRQYLWRHGYRYRLHCNDLPGKPDIVLRRLRTVIFVNGCFWHGHNVAHGAGITIDSSDCCRIPSSNRDFWAEKIRRNMLRDDENTATLEHDGWHVIRIWECQLRKPRREATLSWLLDQLIQIEQPRLPQYRLGEHYADDAHELIAAESQSPYYKQKD